ncbi:MAG: tRNA (N6-isopentenyl adenosine(37)-C2)-methylthiotransferase MiaB [Pyrinomonadaceae bacterium MAG19_C2-C3]|nr:tRNA (N6-isopentenyl adenosine(37)-C2)-methylthiotransferase MiaB [Pyrinomonadaceae bacterium MAG19_C2-C3]
MPEKNRSVYIETLGCQMNVADSERAAGVLRAAAFDLVKSADEADVVILNTCSVRARAEAKVFDRIGEIRHRRNGAQPLIGVMGCVAQLEGEALFQKRNSIGFVAGTRAADRLPDLVNRALGGESRVMDLAERLPGEKWNVGVEHRTSGKTAFVPIIEGCNKFCSYCIVPYSRGREKSRPASEIIREIAGLKTQGYEEVYLIGQNVNSYRPNVIDGLEEVAGATPFAKLLRAVARTGMGRIKFTTSFPRDFHTDIVSALDEHENLCNWVHLPVQSGSDRVLRAMRRGYRIADYMQRVAWIKGARQRLALTSDIIIGYPGETSEDFQQTMELVERCQYDGLYIFKYSERKGTPAAKQFDDVSKEEKASRFARLEELQRSIQTKIYRSYIGSMVEVLVEGASARRADELSGHTTCNKIINFSTEGVEAASLIGKPMPVVVTEAKRNSLYGRIAV